MKNKVALLTVVCLLSLATAAGLKPTVNDGTQNDIMKGNVSDGVNKNLPSPTQVLPGDLIWSNKNSAPGSGRYWCSGTGVVRDTIYFCGGRDMLANSSVRTITAYDIQNSTWITAGLPTLLTPRRAGAGGLIGNKIYVAGGRDSSHNTLYTCEEIDLDTKTVTQMANMPGAGVWASCGAVADDKLYVIGSEYYEGTTYEYDPASNMWSTRASIPVGRGWAAAVGTGGKVYVTGGSDASSNTLQDCWEYNPTANSWTQKASMPGPRIYHRMVAYQDTLLYVLGGSIDGSLSADNIVYKYHIPSNTWSTETHMNTSRGWHMPNVVGNSIWVAYGSDCSTPTYLTNLEEGLIPTSGITELKLVSEKEPSLRIVNPVKKQALLNFSVPQPSEVMLGIYNTTGALVKMLIKERVQPGEYSKTWDRRDAKGKPVACGTYFCRLTVNGRAVSAKAILLQ